MHGETSLKVFRQGAKGVPKLPVMLFSAKREAAHDRSQTLNSQLVGEEGLEPSIPCGQRILSPSCIPIPPLARAEKPAEYAFYGAIVKVRRELGKVPQGPPGRHKKWRRHPESNREYVALQATALPFGYAASPKRNFSQHARDKSICGVWCVSAI